MSCAYETHEQQAENAHHSHSGILCDKAGLGARGNLEQALLGHSFCSFSQSDALPQCTYVLYWQSCAKPGVSSHPAVAPDASDQALTIVIDFDHRAFAAVAPAYFGFQFTCGHARKFKNAMPDWQARPGDSFSIDGTHCRMGPNAPCSVYRQRDKNPIGWNLSYKSSCRSE